MAKINIEIDTERTRYQFDRMTSHKVGLLSSISVSNDLDTAFTHGFGSTNHAKRDSNGYGPDALKQAKKNLKNTDQCDVIATVGGNVVFEAIKNEADNPPFVSLFGELPDLAATGTIGNCLGGVSLNSWKSNGDRIKYLISKLPCTADEVGLYYNSNSAMSPDEVQNWNNINPPVNKISTAKPFSGATAGSPPRNDAARFDSDLDPAANFFPARVKVIVISADPFFQDNKDLLIKAANSWISGDPTNRYICYPLQEYQNSGGAHTPTHQRSTAYGPSLTGAYRLLGFLAMSAIENKKAGFFTAADIITDL